FNGFFKTNSALFTWLYLVSGVVGVKLAARLFTLLCVAVTAVVLPWFVLEMTGSRKKLVISAFFMWPMMHNWFVPMGMLDFALAVPLALVVLVGLLRQSRAPSWPVAAGIVVVSCISWYAHVFPLMTVELLAFIFVATQRTWAERGRQALALFAPL